MRQLLTISAMLAAIMAGMGTSSAVTLQGDCSCTEFPPHCDPDKALIGGNNFTIALRKEMFELCTDEEGCHSD